MSGIIEKTRNQEVKEKLEKFIEENDFHGLIPIINCLEAEYGKVVIDTDEWDNITNELEQLRDN
ncbi:hypothetical protein TPENAI_60870 [Tenacibaculum litopenaei]|uniref:hypothetical protein n=1 Tax=Tenacibaculum litopenaei TaxID=396016 RepID=UPI0038949414